MSLGSSTPGGPVDLEGVNVGTDGGGLFDHLGGVLGDAGGLLGGGPMPGFSQTNQSSAKSSGLFENHFGTGSMTVVAGGASNNMTFLLFGAGVFLYWMSKK